MASLQVTPPTKANGLGLARAPTRGDAVALALTRGHAPAPQAPQGPDPGET